MEENIFCTKCGSENPANAMFCHSCGGALSQLVNQAERASSPVHGLPGKYPKASLGNRFGAAVLDTLIIFCLALPAIIFFGLAIAELGDYWGDEGSAYGMMFFAGLLYIALPLPYSFIKDGLGKGQSWGKKATGLMVVCLSDNTPCTKGKSFLRGLIMGLLGIIPYVGWMVEPIIVLVDVDGRRLGDRAADTQVIDVLNYTG